MKFFCLFIVLLNLQFLHANEISISFDDTPRGDNQYYPGEQRAQKILSALKKVGVEQAIFYANPGKIKKDKEKYDRLMKYHKAGHLVANHTFTHPNAEKTPLKEYLNNFKKADDYLNKMGIRAKYFRYPYLRRGESLEKIRAIRKEIIENQKYIDGYVTIDTYDWYIDWLFQEALKKKRKINYENLKRMYIDAILGSVEFYADLGQKVFNQPLKHVLLLHENDIAALFVEDLLFQLKLNGWKIIKTQDSYKKSILTEYPDHDFHGQGRVAAHAYAKKYKGKLRSKYEDEEFLKKMFIQYGVVLK